MRNFRITVEYDGTDYNGWQAQSKLKRRKSGRVKTIQGILEDALFKLFKKKLNLVSSGRTDSGVHAKAHAANFKVPTKLEPLQIKRALNSLLPHDIVVRRVVESALDFDAQHDVSSKTYRYVICNRDSVSPFVRRYVYHFRQRLDVSVMKREARVLVGTHDFSAFKSSDGKTASCRRTIKRLQVRKKNGFVEIEVEADGFLYNMARSIAGTLIEIGRGKFPPGSMKRILKSRNRKNAGPTVPARGLSLIDVKY